MGEGGSELVGRILPRGPWGLSLVLSLAVPCISGVQPHNLLSVWAWRLALLPMLSLELKPDRSLDPLPIILGQVWALTLFPTTPCTVAVWLCNPQSPPCWSGVWLHCASLPSSESVPCRPGNHITHNAWRPKSDHRGEAQAPLCRRDQSLRGGWS